MFSVNAPADLSSASRSSGSDARRADELALVESETAARPSRCPAGQHGGAIRLVGRVHGFVEQGFDVRPVGGGGGAPPLRMDCLLVRHDMESRQLEAAKISPICLSKTRHWPEVLLQPESCHQTRCDVLRMRPPRSTDFFRCSCATDLKPSIRPGYSQSILKPTSNWPRREPADDTLLILS